MPLELDRENVIPQQYSGGGMIKGKAVLQWSKSLSGIRENMTNRICSTNK